MLEDIKRLDWPEPVPAAGQRHDAGKVRISLGDSVLQGLGPRQVIGRILNAGGAGRPAAERMSRAAASQLHVEFAGSRHGEQLANLLRQHEILVVPSLWREPFGIVALEGIACGCVVIGSAGGGLPEAIGPCGITFPNGGARALADAMKRLLDDPAQRERFRQNAAAHLARFTPHRVAKVYLEAMAKASR